MTRDVWRGDEVTVEPAIPDRPGYGVFVMTRGRRYALGSELTRHLAAWLTAHAGALPPPADPCAVRLAVDVQRAELCRLSERSDSEDFRAGLAWADHALDAIAGAAGAPTERTTR